MESDQMRNELAGLLEATREAERTVFAALDTDLRDAPPAAGAWSPKDVQVHITAWKRRQADRLSAVERGEAVEVLADGEIDAINGREQAAHADWSWDAVATEAEEATSRLVELVRDGSAASAVDSLLSGIVSNGSAHPVEHLSGIGEPGAGQRQVRALDDRLSTLALHGGMPDDLAGVTLYNQACRHALAGRLDAARELLPVAFRHRPDLVAWAQQDTDVEELWAELDALAAQ